MTRLIALAILSTALLVSACGQTGGGGDSFPQIGGGKCKFGQAQSTRNSLVNQVVAARATINTRISASQVPSDTERGNLTSARSALADAAGKNLACADTPKVAADPATRIAFLSLAAEMSREAGPAAVNDTVQTASANGLAQCKALRDAGGQAPERDCALFEVEPNITAMRSAGDVVLETQVAALARSGAANSALTSAELTGLIRAVRDLSNMSGSIDGKRTQGRLPGDANSFASTAQFDGWCRAVLAVDLMKDDASTDTSADAFRLLVAGQAPGASLTQMLSSAGLSQAALAGVYQRFSANILAARGQSGVSATSVARHETLCKSG